MRIFQVLNIVICRINTLGVSKRQNMLCYYLPFKTKTQFPNTGVLVRLQQRWAECRSGFLPASVAVVSHRTRACVRSRTSLAPHPPLTIRHRGMTLSKCLLHGFGYTYL